MAWAFMPWPGLIWEEKEFDFLFPAFIFFIKLEKGKGAKRKPPRPPPFLNAWCPSCLALFSLILYSLWINPWPRGLARARLRFTPTRNGFGTLFFCFSQREPVPWCFLIGPIN